MIEDQTAPVTRDRHEWYWSAKGGSVCRQCGLKIEGRPEVAHEGPCVWVPDAPDPRIKAALAHNDRIGGSRTISYRGMMVMAPLRDIRQAIEQFSDPNRDRRKTMASVNASLARSFPRVESGKASQKEAMECAQDVAIWFANEIVEGRATLEIQ